MPHCSTKYRRLIKYLVSLIVHMASLLVLLKPSRCHRSTGRGRRGGRYEDHSSGKSSSNNRSREPPVEPKFNYEDKSFPPLTQTQSVRCFLAQCSVLYINRNIVFFHRPCYVSDWWLVFISSFKGALVTFFP